MREIKEITLILLIACLLFVASSVYASHSKVDESLPVSSEGNVLYSNSVAVPILIYHSVRPPYEGETEEVKEYTVTPEILDAQFQYIKDEGYTVISMDRLVERMEKGTPIPEKSIVITFDDGWENQIEYGLPVLKKYGYTATFYVYTHALGIKNFMTWDDLKTLAGAGMTIGDHTKTHPYLFKITDSEKMIEEVVGSRKLLEDFLGKPVLHFAYPFGGSNELAVSILKQYGFHSARTTLTGSVNSKENILNLKAFLVQDSIQYMEVLLGSISH